MYKQSDRTHTYQRIAATVASRIRQGAYAEGTYLPSIAAIGAEFGCSQMTTRAALRILERDGLIEMQQGRGSLVLPPPGGRLEQLARIADDLQARAAGLAAQIRAYKLSVQGTASVPRSE